MPVKTPTAVDRSATLTNAPEQWLSWAVFVAMSWTWCIGMFLPVLLVREFGLVGWVIFAVPNVIGAAAMGTVLRTAKRSVDLVFQHAFACAAFSAVTIFFQVFFVGWVVRGLLGPMAILIAVPLAIAIAVISRSDRGALGAAWVVFGASLAAFVAVSFSHAEHVSRHLWFGPNRSIELLGLSAVCIVGFALSPYLDLTFHRARQALQPGPARAAFAVGFLLPFASMIGFTLWYARLLLPGNWDRLPDRLRWIIGAHLLLQATLTIGLHAASVIEAAKRDRAARRGADLGGWIGLLLLLAWGTNRLPNDLRISPDEIAYWLYLGFYGTIFPAYVWICMVPDRSGSTITTTRKLVAVVVTTAIIFPMLWVAFIGRDMRWAIPAMTILVLSRWSFPVDRRYSAGPSRSS